MGALCTSNPAPFSDGWGFWPGDHNPDLTLLLEHSRRTQCVGQLLATDAGVAGRLFLSAHMGALAFGRSFGFLPNLVCHGRQLLILSVNMGQFLFHIIGPDHGIRGSLAMPEGALDPRCLRHASSYLLHSAIELTHRNAQGHRSADTEYSTLAQVECSMRLLRPQALSYLWAN